MLNARATRRNVDSIEPPICAMADRELSAVNLQEELLRNTPKCLICLQHYTKPLVSIGCWHVHCEQCWLATLGAKRLCPQCQTVTSPADLRRVFL